RRWRNDVPDRLVAALQQACAKNPAERYSNAERFAKTLRTFTISPASGQQSPAMAPITHTAGYSSAGYSAAGMGGSSAQMAPVNYPTPQVMQANIPAAI